MSQTVGSTKGTGNGHREAGQAALDVVTEWQLIDFDYSGRRQRAQIGHAPLVADLGAAHVAEQPAQC